MSIPKSCWYIIGEADWWILMKTELNIQNVFHDML